MDRNFQNFFTLSIILRISRKLQRVRVHIECPSCVAYPINSDIRSRDGYPIDSDIRSCGRVPDYFGGRRKPDPTGTRTPLVCNFEKLHQSIWLQNDCFNNGIHVFFPCTLHKCCIHLFAVFIKFYFSWNFNVCNFVCIFLFVILTFETWSYSKWLRW